MADYKELSGESKMWTRACAVSINNPLPPGIPDITFKEQRVTALPDGSFVTKDAGQCSVTFDPAVEFDICDPTTLQPTGNKSTHAQLYLLLFSAYIATAKARDEAAPVEEPVVTPPQIMTPSPPGVLMPVPDPVPQADPEPAPPPPPAP